MEWQKDLKDPTEFLESVKVDLFQDEVFVFTPKGDVRVFPRGATPVDFAYAIHSDVGEHCHRRAGQRQPSFRSATSSERRHGRGDDRPGQHPSKDWLDFVVTGARPGQDPHLPPHRAARPLLKLGKELLEKELHSRA